MVIRYCWLRKDLLGILACPICYCNLDFLGTETNGRLQEGYIKCSSCSQTFRVHDQIPDFRIGDWSKETLNGKGILELLSLDEDKLKSWIEERKTYPETESIEMQDASVRIMKGICSVVKNFPMALDIASGRGRLLKAMAASNPNIQLLGTDIDENMLKGAQKALREEAPSKNASLLLCNVKRLPIRSGSFPCIISFAGFSNMQNPIQALSEVRRVLSSNGRLIFSTLFINEGSRSFEYMRRLRLADMASEDRLRKYLEEANLELLSLEEIYSGIHPGYSNDLLPLRNDWFAEMLVMATPNA
jgi:ubiquinone/menaquinone biosynthesis C-methylase UbiE/uncharacterized protein YbaR (Trm112 family)